MIQYFEQKADLRVERVFFSANNLSDVLNIEARCFPLGWQYPDAKDYYAQELREPNNLSLGLKAEQVMIGYLLATPYSAALRWVGDTDPDMAATDAAMYYVETIAVLPEWSGVGGATGLLRELEREAAARGSVSLAMHARTVNGFNTLARRLAGARLIRTHWLENWPWAEGEPFEYIEWRCASSQSRT